MPFSSMDAQSGSLLSNVQLRPMAAALGSAAMRAFRSARSPCAMRIDSLVKRIDWGAACTRTRHSARTAGLFLSQTVIVT